jgi:MoaA/NifB/PqqE/SkfB family radical SAM enzyme
VTRSRSAGNGAPPPFPYPERPSFIQIETLMACNAECPFCPQHKITRGPTRMHEWVWRKIVEESRGWGVTYRPFLVNEPLLDKRLPEIIRTIKRDPTARVEINTNGELFTEENGERLLEAGIDLVRFSIDGASRETYERSRVGLDFDKVVRRTEWFCRRARGTSCRTEIRMIGMEENRHEQEAYLDFWGERCDEALVVPLYTWPWEGQEEPVLRPCLKIRDEMFFFVDGRASLCCWDTFERGVVGDVRRSSVSEIWNGPALAHYRSLLDRGRRDRIFLCSACDAYKDRSFPGFEDGEPVLASPSH